MGLTFEHDDIGLALVSAGFAINFPSKDAIEEELTLPVFIGWSRRDTLLLGPEYAWLSLNDVKHVQLPQPLYILRTFVERSTHRRLPSLEMVALKTPLGQWRWAVEKVEDSIPLGNGEETLSRLSALARFANTHWPGRFEEILNDFIIRLKSTSLSSEDVQSLTKQADSAAVLSSCRPLLRWVEGQEKGRLIATLEDALSYAIQGFVGADEVVELLSEDMWWSEIEQDLHDTETALLHVSKSGVVVDQIIRNKLEIIKDCLAIIRRTRENSGVMTPEEINEVYAAVNTLLSSVGEIVKQFGSDLINNNVLR